jgi:predicted amidohydrolase
MKLKIAGIQMSLRDATTLKDRDANLDRAEKLARKAAPADLMLLPELFTIGYGKKAFESLGLLAEDRDGPTITRFRRVARELKSFIVFGFPERAGKSVFNSAAVINDRGGLVDVYRKMHIPQFSETMEKDYFRRGGKTCSFNLKGVKTGLIICYDIRFPEITRKLALKDGIQLLVHPVGFCRDETFASWPIFTVTRAIENQVYVLSVNRAGKNNGGSLFAPPRMEWRKETRILGQREAVIKGTVDTRLLDKIRNTYQYRKDLLDEY